jgi:hypothetical protein
MKAPVRTVRTQRSCLIETRSSWREVAVEAGRHGATTQKVAWAVVVVPRSPRAGNLYVPAAKAQQDKMADSQSHIRPSAVTVVGLLWELSVRLGRLAVTAARRSSVLPARMDTQAAAGQS